MLAALEEMREGAVKHQQRVCTSTMKDLITSEIRRTAGAATRRWRRRRICKRAPRSTAHRNTFSKPYILLHCRYYAKALAALEEMREGAAQHRDFAPAFNAALHSLATDFETDSDHAAWWCAHANATRILATN